MPLYYFVLKSGATSVVDKEGEELPNEAAARAHAESVARELMRTRESGTRSWRVDVLDENLEPRFRVLFASLDDTMSQYPPELRQSIETTSGKQASLGDVIADMRRTLTDVRETLSRAQQMPYVSFNGLQRR